MGDERSGMMYGDLRFAECGGRHRKPGNRSLTSRGPSVLIGPRVESDENQKTVGGGERWTNESRGQQSTFISGREVDEGFDDDVRRIRVIANHVENREGKAENINSSREQLFRG